MILIAIGSNLPGPGGSSARENCVEAVKAMRDIPGLSCTAVSAWYRTAPVPASDQPDYCNGMIRMEGEIGAAALLAAVNEIETQLGRVRSFPNAPRVIDLDLIDLNGMIRATPAPILPHPRAHLREFVLRPLLDVAPGWRHPTFRVGLPMLMAELGEQKVIPWTDG